MTFRVRREQASVLRKSQYVERLTSALAETGSQTSTDPNGDILLTDPTGRITRVAVGANGLPVSATTPEGRTYRSDIGDDGRLRGLTNAGGFHVGLEYDATGRISRLSAANRETWRLRYDDPGRVAEIRYADSTTTRFRYGGASGPLAVTNRLGNTETFRFDGNKLVSLLDGKGNETRFEYGIWDRPDRAILPDGSTESYSYDANGGVAGIRWGTSGAVALERNPAGQPLQFNYSDGQTLRFAYDDAGNPIEAVSEGCDVRFRWAQAGRVAEEHREGSSVAYSYGPTGNLEAITYPDGDKVRFEYDRDGRVLSVTDWSGGRHSYKHQADDRGYLQSSPGGLTTKVALSPRGLPTATVVENRAGHQLFATTYTHDSNFKASSIADSEFGLRRFSYDAEGQLLSARRADDTEEETFAYDAAGNRTGFSGQVAAFDALNQVRSHGGTPCAYDARGNAATLAARGGLWTLTWNQRNLLVVAEGPAGQRLTFGYDAFGRRIWKRQEARPGAPETSSRYIWAGEHLITQVTQMDSVERRQDFLYLPGTFSPVATRIDGRVYTYHCDHRGAPTRLTDEQGDVVWSATYAAFGEAEIHRHDVDNSLRLPGQWEDSETGLHYNRFRYYSPLLGRFLSRDPISFIAGPNLYAYAGNDPINHIDPPGLWKGWEVAVAVAAGVAAAAVVVAIAVTAPISVPVLIIAAGAAAMGVGVGLGTYKAITLKDPDPATIGKAFLSGFVDGALFTAAVVGAMFVLPGAAAAIAVGGAGLGIYSMCSEHFGWAEGSVPFSEMSAEQQNKSVGGLWGGLIGSLAVGGLVARGSRAPGSAASSIAARQATAEAFYRTAGWPEPRIASHLQGIDFTQPVKPVTLPTGTEVVQYQIPGNPTGNYFAPLGTPAEAIGVNPAGRVTKVYTTTSDVTVLQSTAADTSSNPNVPALARGQGGGVQFFAPNTSGFSSP